MRILLYDRKPTLLAEYDDDADGSILALAVVGDRVLMRSGVKPPIYERVFNPVAGTLSIYLRSIIDPVAEGFATAEEPTPTEAVKRTVPKKSK